MYSSFVEADNKWDFLRNIPMVGFHIPNDNRTVMYTDVSMFTTQLIGGYIQNAYLVIPINALIHFEEKEGEFLRKYFELYKTCIGDLCIIRVSLADYPPIVFKGIIDHWQLVNRTTYN